jgi:hypothetical protein
LIYIKLCTGLAQHQHGDVRMRQHNKCLATQQQALDAFASVGGYDD